MEIRNGSKGNKGRRCEYSDGDQEDLSIRQQKKLKRITPLYLTQRKEQES